MEDCWFVPLYGGLSNEAERIQVIVVAIAAGLLVLGLIIKCVLQSRKRKHELKLVEAAKGGPTLP